MCRIRPTPPIPTRRSSRIPVKPSSRRLGSALGHGAGATGCSASSCRSPPPPRSPPPRPSWVPAHHRPTRPSSIPPQVPVLRSPPAGRGCHARRILGSHSRGMGPGLRGRTRHLVPRRRCGLVPRLRCWPVRDRRAPPHAGRPRARPVGSPRRGPVQPGRAGAGRRLGGGGVATVRARRIRRLPLGAGRHQRSVGGRVEPSSLSFRPLLERSCATGNGSTRGSPSLRPSNPPNSRDRSSASRSPPTRPTAWSRSAIGPTSAATVRWKGSPQVRRRATRGRDVDHSGHAARRVRAQGRLRPERSRRRPAGARRRRARPVRAPAAAQPVVVSAAWCAADPRRRPGLGPRPGAASAHPTLRMMSMSSCEL